jgi:hypothetical protein
VFVAAVIVEDDVDDLAGRDLGLDGVEEADELLVPVALHAAPDDFGQIHWSTEYKYAARCSAPSWRAPLRSSQKPTDMPKQGARPNLALDGERPIQVVGHGRAAPLFHRQTRLGAVESLDLAFLIDAEQHGVGGRIDTEADDDPTSAGSI